MKQTVDGLCGYVYEILFSARVLIMGVYHILREVSARLLVQLRWAHARASNRGTGNKYGSHAFSFLTKRQ